MLVTRRNAPDSRSSLIYGTEVESANSTRKAGPLVMRLSYVAQNTRSQRYVFMRPLLALRLGHGRYHLRRLPEEQTVVGAAGAIPRGDGSLLSVRCSEKACRTRIQHRAS